MEKILAQFRVVMNEVEGKYEADAYQPKVTFNFSSRVNTRCLADFSIYGGINIYMFSIVKDMSYHGMSPGDIESLGKEIIRHLAHEWRHEQQELLWDTDIPSVTSGAKSFMGKEINDNVYWEDPGEADARQFSELVLQHMPTKHIRAVGRLFRYLIRKEIAKAKAAA